MSTPEGRNDTHKQIGGGWAMESHRGHYVFHSPRGGMLPLRQALKSGILDAVRNARNLSVWEMAVSLHVQPDTIWRWKNSVAVPRGLYKEKLEQWLWNTEDWPLF